MHPLLSCIKSVGFDLDQTLYPSNPEIDDRIRDCIAMRILEKKSEFRDIKEVRRVYEEKHREVGSWTQILEEVGFREPKKIMYECLVKADILDLIKKDNELVSIIQNIKEKYSTFLITSSPKDLAISKLIKIGISPVYFECTIFGDDKNFISKTSNRVFEYFLTHSLYLPHQHVYIGDNLKADILPPKSLGMKTIAVGKKFIEADFSIEAIHDIRKLLL